MQKISLGEEMKLTLITVYNMNYFPSSQTQPFQRTPTPTSLMKIKCLTLSILATST